MKRYVTVTLGRATPFAYGQMALLQLGVMTYSQAERGLFFLPAYEALYQSTTSVGP